MPVAGGDKDGRRPAARKVGDPGRHARTGMDDVDFFFQDNPLDLLGLNFVDDPLNISRCNLFSVIFKLFKDR